MFSKSSYSHSSKHVNSSKDNLQKNKKVNGDFKTECLMSLEKYNSRNSFNKKQYVISKKMKALAMKKKKKIAVSEDEEEPSITLQMDLSECEDEEVGEKEEDQINYGSDSAEEEEKEEEEEEEEQEEDVVEETIRTIKKPRLVQTWVDCYNGDVPSLELPPSSSDLPIESCYVMQTLGIYEVLRHFSRYLRLSIFRFEDLCMAISHSEQSSLIVEVHIALLKHLLRADDSANFVFGPQDTKDSINIIFNNIDYLTWYEVVRAYLSSRLDVDKPLGALEHTSYPQSSIAERLEVLQCLSDLALSSPDIRNDIITEELFVHEDQCRVCHKYAFLFQQSCLLIDYFSFITEWFISLFNIKISF